MYDVWHVRAVFHFLTSIADKSAYVRQVIRAVRRSGHVDRECIPTGRATSLQWARRGSYDAESLHAEFGSNFRLISSRQLHETPSGTTQQVLYIT